MAHAARAAATGATSAVPLSAAERTALLVHAMAAFGATPMPTNFQHAGETFIHENQITGKHG